jgi:hypothetical protein
MMLRVVFLFLCVGSEEKSFSSRTFEPLFFFGFRVDADDFLGIELNFLSIYKGTFRSFFPNGEKKTKSQTASQLFFQKLFFSLLDAVRMIFSV